MTTDQIYAAGYAVPVFCMYGRYWRHRERWRPLPSGAVPEHTLEGVPFPVARAADVWADERSPSA